VGVCHASSLGVGLLLLQFGKLGIHIDIGTFLSSRGLLYLNSMHVMVSHSQATLASVRFSQATSVSVRLSALW